jgi:hypothetical protein
VCCWYFSDFSCVVLPAHFKIFMNLLRTLSMGEKTSVRLTPGSKRFASVMRSGVFLPPTVRAGVHIRAIAKNGRSPSVAKVNENVMLRTWPHPILAMALKCLRVPSEAEKTALWSEPFAPRYINCALVFSPTLASQYRVLVV